MNPDQSALFSASPRDYGEIAATHADHIPEEEALLMVREYLQMIIRSVVTKETFSSPEKEGLYAAYTAHLFVELFQRQWRLAEKDLVIRKQLERILENS